MVRTYVTTDGAYLPTTPEGAELFLAELEEGIVGTIEVLRDVLERVQTMRQSPGRWSPSELDHMANEYRGSDPQID